MKALTLAFLILTLAACSKEEPATPAPSTPTPPVNNGVWNGTSIPTIVSPEAWSTGHTPPMTVRWNKVPGATHYYLLIVAGPPDGYTPHISYPWHEIMSMQDTTYTTSAPLPNSITNLPGRTIGISVVAYGPEGEQTSQGIQVYLE
jgi:hypothetical protein